MTTTETQPVIINTESINETTYKRYINVKPSSNEYLSFSDWAAREQVTLLRSINGKLSFFVLLIIIGIIVSLFRL